jgi:hypothetical protein
MFRFIVLKVDSLYDDLHQSDCLCVFESLVVGNSCSFSRVIQVSLPCISVLGCVLLLTIQRHVKGAQFKAQKSTHSHEFNIEC